MCKHVAAILYGVGSRLDEQPELLFRLHKVNEAELIAKAGKKLSLSSAQEVPANILDSNEDLSAMFGLDIVGGINSNRKRPVNESFFSHEDREERVKRSSGEAPRISKEGRTVQTPDQESMMR
jgi:uncharacterized Zn finger protein